MRPTIADAVEAIRALILPRYPEVRTAKLVKQEQLPEMAMAVAKAYYPDLVGKAQFSGAFPVGFDG
ncbi:MAG: hypothetical protein JOZ22_22960 [Acidobacteriia bacterium]|nr:hypothetical protein [Terriglobia bacterium]